MVHQPKQTAEVGEMLKNLLISFRSLFAMQSDFDPPNNSDRISQPRRRRNRRRHSENQEVGHQHGHREHHAHARTPRVPPAQGNPETIQALANINLRYANKRRRAKKIVAVITLIAAGYAMYKWSDWHWWSIGFVLFWIVMGINIFFPNGTINEATYRSIPGSNDKQGRHICIYCGWRGIHRKGQYKSEAVQANCSKCGSYLWSE